MFEELWNIAHKDLPLQDEVYVVEEESGERYGSTSSSEFPWTCVLKTELGELVYANRLQITSESFFGVFLENPASEFNTNEIRE